jgi:hypothetical protein
LRGRRSRIRRWKLDGGGTNSESSGRSTPNSTQERDREKAAASRKEFRKRMATFFSPGIGPPDCAAIAPEILGSVEAVGDTTNRKKMMMKNRKKKMKQDSNNGNEKG